MLDRQRNGRPLREPETHRPTHDETTLRSLEDAALLSRTRALAKQHSEVEADLVECLMEIDRRRLHSQLACDSLFTFCVRFLGSSEGAAYNRIQVARAAKRHPSMLTALRERRIHLTGLRLLAPHLTEENCDRVLAEAEGKTKEQILEIIARLAPRPDAPASIRKLPSRPHAPPQDAVSELSFAGASNPRQDGADGDGSHPKEGASGAVPRDPHPGAGPRGAGSGVLRPPLDSRGDVRRRASMDPLSEDRFLLKATISGATRDDVLEAKDLLRHQIPDGDLGILVGRAFRLLVEDTLKQQYGIGRKPREQKPKGMSAKEKDEEQDPSGPATRHIPFEIRRQVYIRDGGRCAFIDPEGNRCGARAFLQLHHLDGFELVKAHDVDRIELRCAAHNQAEADELYGREKMDAHRRTKL